VLAGQQAKPLFYTIEGSSSADATIIEARLLRALVTFNSDLIEARTRPGATGTITADDMRLMRERPDRVTLAATYAGRQPVPTGFSFSLPSNLVMYVMMNLLIFGGSSVASARREGVLRHLMSACAPW
jgi:ABC-type multidrug transport system permease subunit